MNTRLVPALVLAVALVTLVGTVGYAIGNRTESGLGFGGMHGGAYAMMGSGGKSTAWYTDGTGSVRDIAAARGQAQRFAGRLGLTPAEVMQFSNNFYVRLDDKTGRPATEVLIDPQTGVVTLEYGPAMMWNTRYGMMGGTSGGGMMGGTGMLGTGMTGSSMMGASGMMGRQGGSPSWTPSDVTGPVSAAQARRLANRWLSQERPGATATEPDAFPGYYTMDTSRNGKVEGMLSVSREAGALWYHWWHGRFVAMDA
jgi:hypothetical protein